MGLADTLRKKVENHENKTQEEAKIRLEKIKKDLEIEIKKIHEDFKGLESELKKMSERGLTSYKILDLNVLCVDTKEIIIRKSNEYYKPEIWNYIDENAGSECIKSDALLDFWEELENDGFTPYFDGSCNMGGITNVYLAIKW